MKSSIASIICLILFVIIPLVAQYGVLDSNFNMDGTSSNCPSGVSLQEDLKILVNGTVFPGSIGTAADFRRNDDVALDVVTQSDGKLLLVGFTFNGFHDIALAKYLSGLEVGIIDFANQDHNFLIYPNPLQDNATIKYSLINDEIISIDLFEMSGRVVQSIVNTELRIKGDYEEVLGIDASLPRGSYIMTISNG